MNQSVCPHCGYCPTCGRSGRDSRFDYFFGRPRWVYINHNANQIGADCHDAPTDLANENKCNHGGEE